MITIRFTNKQRYGKALNHLWNNSDRYKVVCRGKDYGADIKAHGLDHGFYIEFEKI